MTSEHITTLYEGKFLRLQKNGRWEYAERVNARGAAFILAITAQNEIVLVEQHRVPLNRRTLELPAGIIGDLADHATESIVESAIRELEEETGYRAAVADIILEGPVAAGLTSEMLYLVHAKELVRVHDGGGDESENITVHVVPLSKAHEWLEQKRAQGLLIEPRIYTGLYFAQREQKQSR
jgi:ADP-ribose pyrophosphatase